jgi:glycosyltransferase involved in cell wall biosynthesis
VSTSTSDLEIGESRRRLLREVGTPPDLTVVRCQDGPHDEPVWAGIGELLREHIYREIDRDGLCAARGHTALLSVDGDAFCRPADELTARALAVAELRFERVIVLPAGFDPSDDTTRAALTASRATIFAHDPQSFRRIAPLCDARLAHDCACFSGAAAAMPESGPDSQPPNPAPVSATARRPGTSARVTAIVLSRGAPEQALRAIDSLAGSTVSVQALLIDNNSSPPESAVLRDGCARRTDVCWLRADRNLGCAGGRRLGIDAAEGELVLLLDDDAELEPGALDLLVAEIDAHPEAAAVTATVELSDGTLHHSGGWMSTEDQVVKFTLIGAGQPASDPVPPSGNAGWVPGTAALARASALREFPLDAGIYSYFEDNEWCYRVERARPGSFRRSREARAVHHFTSKHGPGTDFATRSVAVDVLGAHARFYARHGKLLDLSLFDLVPELRDNEGTGDVAAARLLMELLLAKGGDWTFMEWMNGGLEVLLGCRARASRLGTENAEQARLLAERDRELDAQRAELEFLRRRDETLERVINGGWWRLRTRVMPAVEVAQRLRRGMRR